MPLWSMEVYYHLLNCGFRLPVSAGSASGVKASPLGYNRVYVKVSGSVLVSELVRVAEGRAQLCHQRADAVSDRRWPGPWRRALASTRRVPCASASRRSTSVRSRASRSFRPVRCIGSISATRQRGPLDHRDGARLCAEWLDRGPRLRARRQDDPLRAHQSNLRRTSGFRHRRRTMRSFSCSGSIGRLPSTPPTRTFARGINRTRCWRSFARPARSTRN